MRRMRIGVRSGDSVANFVIRVARDLAKSVGNRNEPADLVIRVLRQLAALVGN
jgi:hypothetical protein